MGSVKRERLDLLDLVERTAEVAVRLYDLHQSEYGLMPGPARRAAISEAMEGVEDRISERLNGGGS